MKTTRILLISAAALVCALLCGCGSSRPHDPAADDGDITELPTAAAVITAAPTEAPEATDEPASTGEPGDEVHFYSPRFELIFREQTGRPSGPIYEADVKSTKKLEFKDERVYELRDLTMFENLEELSLEGTGVEDISVLRQMRSLKKLTLVGNRYLKDYSPIASLTGLRELRCVPNNKYPLSDLSLFAGMNDLESLNVMWFESSDLTPISGMTKLKTLTLQNLSENRINDISVVANFPDLELLNIPGDFTDLTPLTGLTKMRELVLTCKAADLSPIAGMTELTRLYIDDRNVTDISALSGMKKLVHLSLYVNVKDISALAGTTELDWLEIPNSRIEDISPLADSKKLTLLRLFNNKISDISVLSKMTALTDLSIWGNNVSDATPLYSLTNLKYLGIGENNLSDEQKQALKEHFEDHPILIEGLDD